MAFTQDNVTYSQFAKIVKIEDQDDGSVLVYGKCTGDDLDKDQQIIDMDFTRAKLPEWHKAHGNIRQMHSPHLAPAGKGLELDEQADGFYLKSRIVEPTAVLLVKNGVYDSYSVGIRDARIKPDKIAKNGRIFDGEYVEVSLVDNPALPSAKFTICKAFGETVDKMIIDGEVTKINAAEDETPSWLADFLAKGTPDQENAVTSDLQDVANDVMDLAQDVAQAQADQDEDAGMADDDVEKGYSIFEHAYLLIKGNDPEFLEYVTKGKIDPSVGGGVDRDKIPDEDFAGPNRTYPIVIPKDVHDAALLIGHADDPAAVKAEIIAIAKRKGPKFVARLPKEWTKLSEPETIKEVKPAMATEETVNKDADAAADDGEDCKTCKGKGTIREGHVKCPDCKGKMPEKADDAETKKGKKMPAEEAPDAPPADEGTPDDSNDGEDDDAEKALLVKSIHGLFCPAFPLEDVQKEYPIVNKADSEGIALSSGPAARQLVWSLLQKEIADDNGTGNRSQAIADLSEAFGVLKAFNAYEKEQELDIFSEIHGEQHEAFKSAYPNANVSVAQFDPGSLEMSINHPPLAAGRQSVEPGNGPQGVPSGGMDTQPEDVGTAGGVSAGREADSPGNSGGDRTPNRVFYTVQQREQAMQAYAHIHDLLTQLSPTACPMGVQNGPVTLNAEDNVMNLSNMDMAAAPAIENMDTRGGIKENVSELQKQIDAAVQAALAEKLEDIQTLQSEVTRLSGTVQTVSQYGVGKYALRAWAGTPFEEVQTEAEQRKDAEQAAKELRKAQLMEMVSSGSNPDMAKGAREQLNQIYKQEQAEKAKEDSVRRS